MNKTNHLILTQKFNETAPKGHEVVKIYTHSHSDRVMSVDCSCGKRHHADINKVWWPQSVATVVDKPVDPNGVHGANYNNF